MAIITDEVTWTTSTVTYWVTTEGTEDPPSEEDAVEYAESEYGYPSMQSDPYRWGHAVMFERQYD